MEIESYVNLKTHSKDAPVLRCSLEENLLSFDLLYEVEAHDEVRFIGSSIRQLAIYDLIDEIGDLGIECKIEISRCNDPSVKNKVVYFKRGMNGEMKKITTE
ncbi:hypothetical protein [Acinetobacter sp. YH12145]|uniref:hypothetical protein n=1 Tax=Acinetobacter sp. YH12145 TaxID=2601129 RepID=UPI0015D2552B|nr:hypothetical protein [Acinetobacter sp. YH12145]